MARSFDGSTTVFYADLGIGAPTGFATGVSFAMACWVNFTSLASANQTMIGKGFDGTTTNYNLEAQNSPLLRVQSFPGAGNGLNDTWTAGTGVWRPIYCDWDSGGATWHLAIAGTVVSGGATGPQTISASRYFGFGGVDTVGSGTPAIGNFIQLLSGSLADVAIWNGPIGSTGISQLAGSTGVQGSATRANAITTSATLLGYWKFLNGTGSTESDLSGNGKTATAIGSPGGVADPIELQPIAAILMGAICL